MSSYIEEVGVGNSPIYKDYLLHKQWKQIRQERLNLDSGKCVFCKEDAVHVHHLSYKSIFKELLIDLISVCCHCHQKLHPKKDLNCK